MSTPRRDWPRSRGMPITRIFLGLMLEKDAVVGPMSLSNRRVRRERRVRKFIYDSAHAVLQHRNMKINQQP